MSQKAILQATYVHLLMNDEMMNAYERFVFTFPDEHSQKF